MCTKALCMAFAGTLIRSALNIHALWKWVEKTPTSPASFLSWRVYMWGGLLHDGANGGLFSQALEKVYHEHRARGCNLYRVASSG